MKTSLYEPVITWQNDQVNIYISFFSYLDLLYKEGVQKSIM